MDPILTGLLFSVALTLIFFMLVTYEGRTGVRILGRMRAFADVTVLRIGRAVHAGLVFFGRDFIRQVFRYIFHRLLQVILSIIRRCEHGLRNMMQVNRTLAQSMDREREVRSKLEEVALHKATHALSEEEKREHRDRMLLGN